MSSRLPACLWPLPLTGLLTGLLTGCAGHQPPAPLTPPLAAASVVSTRPIAEARMHRDSPPPSASAVAQDPAPPAPPQALAAPPPTPTPAIEAQVEVERPYKTFQRPRAQGPVFAAGEDETLARWNLGGTGDPSFISNRAGFHPGARVVVDTELIAGQLPAKSGPGLTQRGLLAQSRSRGYWPLRLCYEDALRRNSELSGETRLRLSIGRSGKVTRATLQKTALDAEAGRCLSLAVENLSYDPAPAAGLVAAELSVKFWRGDAPVPATGPAPGVLFENPGRLEPDVVAGALAPAIPAVEACYARRLERDPALWGRLALRIDLGDDGAIESVREDESRFPDREVSQCVVAQLGELTFPAPAGGSLSFVQAFRLGAPPEPHPLEPPPAP
ncbi:MAG TPA: AgmX/PglI C-terminal domain-containing protein [Polyangiaceae bacterium]